MTSDRFEEEPLFVGNLFRERRADGRRHQNNNVWTLFVSTSPFDVVAPSSVQSVTYKLHPTFHPRTVTVSEPPFLLTRRSWGYFRVDVAIELKHTAVDSTTATRRKVLSSALQSKSSELVRAKMHMLKEVIRSGEKATVDLRVSHPICFGPVMFCQSARGAKLPFVLNSAQLTAAYSDESAVAKRAIEWSDAGLGIRKCAEQLSALRLEGFRNTAAEIVEVLTTASMPTAMQLPTDVATVIANFATLCTLSVDSCVKLEVANCFNCQLSIVSPLRGMHSLRLDSCEGVAVRFSNADRMVEMRECVGCTLHSAECSNPSSVRVEHCTDARLQMEDSRRSLYLMDLLSHNTLLQMRSSKVLLQQYSGPKPTAERKCFLVVWRGAEAVADLETHQFTIGQNLSDLFADG